MTSLRSVGPFHPGVRTERHAQYFTYTHICAIPDNMAIIPAFTTKVDIRKIKRFFVFSEQVWSKFLIFIRQTQNKMATVKYLTRTKVSKLAPVYIRFRDKDNTDLWVQTPYKMFPEYWNNKKQEFKKNMLYTGVFTEKMAREQQRDFDKLSDTILDEFNKLTTNVTTEWLTKVINTYYYKKTPGTENFNQYVARYVEEAKTGDRLAKTNNTQKRYGYGSIRNLQGFKLSFEMFCNGKQYDFNDINIDTYNAFLKFFRDRNCSANYIGKHIKSWKTIMRKAREEGLHKNSDIELKAFKTISEETSKIYLSEVELKAIYDLDLSDEVVLKKVRPEMASNKRLRESRDVFLVGCYIAQRYSDYSRVGKDMIKTIDGKQYLEIYQQKTKTKCLIPLRPEAIRILQQYDYTLPKTFEQKINKDIKDIGELAGITEVITVQRDKGGFTVEKKVKKCSEICTHTARRSGCTNMYLAGIPTLKIMKISGHKSEREFLKYIRVSQEETAIDLSSHNYFAGPQLKVAR